MLTIKIDVGNAAFRSIRKEDYNPRRHDYALDMRAVAYELERLASRLEVSSPRSLAGGGMAFHDEMGAASIRVTLSRRDI